MTIVGAALQIVMSGLVGCLSGLATPGGRLSGLGAALAWYFFCILFLWETNRSLDAYRRDPADSLDRLLSLWLGVGMAQTLSQGATRKPGRLMGTVTISVPYFFRSSLNFAALPSSRKVSPADS